MPGFAPTTQALSVRNGNSVAIVLGDQIIAFAQTAGHQLPFGTEQLYGIGSSKPQEIQQLRMSPQFSLDSFALTASGEQLLQGGVNLGYILAGSQFTMHVQDGLANPPTVLYTYVGAKCQNFSESIPANAPVRDSYSFLALDVLDANGNSIMDDGNNAIQVASSAVSIAANIVGNNLGVTA